MTTREQIRGWLEAGKKKGATHMIVKWDTFDGPFDADYPVYVMPGQDAREVADKNGDRTVECYSYALSLDMQLGEHRAFHWD